MMIEWEDTQCKGECSLPWRTRCKSTIRDYYRCSLSMRHEGDHMYYLPNIDVMKADETRHAYVIWNDTRQMKGPNSRVRTIRCL